MRTLKDKAFLFLIIAVSLAFAWILSPFYSAILWAIVLAILFAPLFRLLLRSMPRSLAALVTALIIILMVILPLTLVAASLVQEATNVYESIRSGQLNVARFIQQAIGVLPAWLEQLGDHLGLKNVEEFQEKLSAGIQTSGAFIASQALSIGQNTFDFIVGFFVMIYLLFFFLRDGDVLAKRIKDAVPLRADQKTALLTKFTIVIRATVKGDLLVAVVQGALGGLIFWLLGVRAPLLCAVLMAFLSLLPAVGSGLVWLPVAVYFLATGAVWHGVILIVYGVLVIGLVDNIMRPRLVGKDTKMPDYVVLLSTMGGIAIFGINGFVIGPVVAAMFIAAWDIFISEAKAERDRNHRVFASQ